MCVMSMIGDHYRDKFTSPPYQFPAQPQPFGNWPPTPGPSQADFDKLKAEVEEMKKLLAKAKDYDERNGEPDCEIDEKMALLSRIAKAVGVDLDDVLAKRS